MSTRTPGVEGSPGDEGACEGLVARQHVRLRRRRPRGAHGVIPPPSPPPTHCCPYPCPYCTLMVLIDRHRLYMYGGVGCGKTFVMDIFFVCAPVKQKRRAHFHGFMLEVLHVPTRPDRGRPPARGFALALLHGVLTARARRCTSGCTASGRRGSGGPTLRRSRARWWRRGGASCASTSSTCTQCPPSCAQCSAPLWAGGSDARGARARRVGDRRGRRGDSQEPV